MKIKAILSLLLVTATISVQAGSGIRTRKPDPVRFAIGVHTGLDIGAAVPWPPGQVIGGGNQMHAIPRLTPALGISYTTIFDNRWSLSCEATYKTVALDADIWTSSQIFHDKDPAVPDKEFRGTASAKMSFTMLEVPLYTRYTFKNGNNRILFGGYYAWVINGTFDTKPEKGTIENMDTGKVEPFSKDDDLKQSFSENLGHWDAGVILGYERRLAPKVALSGRFMMGFKDIFKPGENYLSYSMLNMRGSVVLSYFFMMK